VVFGLVLAGAAQRASATPVSGFRPHALVAHSVKAIPRAPTSDDQDQLEEKLLEYVNRTDPWKYSPREIDSIARLLADNRVKVHYWIVEALLPFGDRARREEPYLQAAYSADVCVLIAAHVRRRYGVYDINAVEGEMIGLKIKPKPALCPSGPHPGAPMRYYDDPVLQQSLEGKDAERKH
jgi:hypothetical protein